MRPQSSRPRPVYSGKAFGSDTQPGLIPRVRKLPWISHESAWQQIIEIVARKPTRTRLMFAMSYDGALRREELCVLRPSDVDPARQLIKARAERQKTA